MKPSLWQSSSLAFTSIHYSRLREAKSKMSGHPNCCQAENVSIDRSKNSADVSEFSIPIAFRLKVNFFFKLSSLDASAIFRARSTSEPSVIVWLLLFFGVSHFICN